METKKNDQCSEAQCEDSNPNLLITLMCNTNQMGRNLMITSESIFYSREQNNAINMFTQNLVP